MAQGIRRTIAVSFLRRLQLHFVVGGYRVLQFIVGIIIFYLFSPRVRICTRTMRHSDKDNIPWSRTFRLQKPYILLAKHSSAWDPFILGVVSRAPMHFISTDINFRTPLLRFLLHVLGTGSIQKNTRDLKAVMEILYLLKTKREPVCLFPEGLNTWDGNTHGIDSAIGKLIARSGVQVYCALIQGAYCAHPRWGKRPRRGRIDISIIPIVHSDTCLHPSTGLSTSPSTETVMQKITHSLNHHDLKTPRSHWQWYSVSQKRAEYIERLLFACPRCLSFNSIFSKNNDFYCTHCLAHWSVSREGHFTQGQHIAENSPHDWNTWQKHFLSKQLKTFSCINKVFFYDPHTCLYLGKKAEVHVGTGTFSLLHTEEGWKFQWKDYSTPKAQKRKQKRATKPLSAYMPWYKHVRHSLNDWSYEWILRTLSNINIQNNEKMEWKDGPILYQTYPLTPRRNTYKYLLAHEILTSSAS